MQTVIPWGDPKAQKRWGSDLAIQSLSKSYFTRKFIGKGDNNIIEQKDELQSNIGDRVSFDLSMQLRGKPTTGDQRLDGKEEGLKFYTDEVIIDQTRKAVNCGATMSQKRTVHDLRKTGRSRLSDYWAKYIDELYFIYLAGARGINEDFIEDENFTGHAGNPIQVPDSQHILFGGSATSKATITASDKMDVAVVERAVTNAKMMRATDPDAANMVPMTIGSENHFVLVMSPYQEHDLRTAAGAQNWLEIQKAAAAAEGSKNKIFTGRLGMINNAILHCHESNIRFNDYGAGSDVLASRALFMGRQAAVCAYGFAKKGRMSWTEKKKDYDNDHNVAAGTIIGVKKTRFNNRDFGVQAIDTAAAPPSN